MDKSQFIAIYARVPTARQEEEQTIQTQISSLKDYAMKSNLDIVEEYLDDGWSGDILARPALDKLRHDAKNKLWTAVLIYDPDRLARRYSYQELVMDELREAGIEVIFVTIKAPKNSEDKILHGVRGLFAEYERIKIAERFRLGKVRKVKEGHILVSEPLFGYSYIPKTEHCHGYYIINQQEANTVKMIFSWVVNDHLSLRGIVRKLQHFNIKPRKSKRGVWATSTLTTMLRNEAYIGKAHWGSSIAVVPTNPIKTDQYKKVKKSSRRLRPQNEWYSIPVPRIISDELFMKARHQLKSNFDLCQRNKKKQLPPCWQNLVHMRSQKNRRRSVAWQTLILQMQ
jgi:site-specific DNA recombinase